MAIQLLMLQRMSVQNSASGAHKSNPHWAYDAASDIPKTIGILSETHTLNSHLNSPSMVSRAIENPKFPSSTPLNRLLAQPSQL